MNETPGADPNGLPPPAPATVQAPPPQRDDAAKAGIEPGRLTPAWRAVVAVTWVGVMAAWAAVWNASVQIGLSTWWLGARGDPQPAVIRLVPFMIAGVVVIAALNHLRATPWIGVAAGVALGLIALGDVGRVDRLALVEGLIALVAIAVSAVAATGRYRHAA